jgi:hypothetical protein
MPPPVYVRACAASLSAPLLQQQQTRGLNSEALLLTFFFSWTTGHIGSIKNKKLPYQVHHITNGIKFYQVVDTGGI